MQRVLIVGAGSRLGFEIARRLVADGHAVTATFRTERPGLCQRIESLGAVAQQLDLGNHVGLKSLIEGANAVVLVPLLSTSVAAARYLRADQKAVFLSSNNVAVAPHEPLYQALQKAESAVRTSSIKATILRPTMIYGHVEDRNFARLATALRRWLIVPRPLSPALQQPVYFKDLAAAACAAVSQDLWIGKTVAVAGPDLVTYRQIYAAVLRAARLRRLVIPVPMWLALRALRLSERLGLNVPVGAHQVLRTDLDKRAQGETVHTGATSLEAGVQQLMAEMIAMGKMRD